MIELGYMLWASALDRKQCNNYVKNEASNDNEFSRNSENMIVRSDDGNLLSDICKSAIDESNAQVSNATCRRCHKLKWKNDFLANSFSAR